MKVPLVSKEYFMPQTTLSKQMLSGCEQTYCEGNGIVREMSFNLCTLLQWFTKLLEVLQEQREGGGGGGWGVDS